MTESSESTATTVDNSVKNLTVQDGEDDDKVDPWNVTSASDTGVNYDKLIGIKIINY